MHGKSHEFQDMIQLTVHAPDSLCLSQVGLRARELRAGSALQIQSRLSRVFQIFLQQTAILNEEGVPRAITLHKEDKTRLSEKLVEYKHW